MSGDTRPSYEFGPFRLDLSEHQLLRGGVPVPLTPKTFELLRVLVQHAGHLVEKDTLLKEVWPDNFVEEGALNRSISVIRKLLGEGTGRKYIETVPKRGYRFIAPVTELRSESGASRVDHHEGRTVPSEDNSNPGDLPPVSWAAAGAAITLVLVVAGFSYVLLHRHSEQVPQRSIDPAHRQVTFTGREGAPTLSPDGKRIAYVSHDSPEKKLMVQELSGGSPLTIFSAPEVGHLRWSPDGNDLIVWARGEGHDGVYVIPQMGGTPRLIAKRMYIGCWSPDGSTIAAAGVPGNYMWLVDRQGTRLRTLSLQTASSAIWDVDWSEPARLLTFTSSDLQGRFTLWTVRPDGSQLAQVVTEPTPIYSARWAPAGDVIYYLGHVNQTDTLYKISLASGHSAEVKAAGLLSGLETDQSFALSKDGKRLVYARSSYYSNLWKLDLGADGHIATTELTHGTSIVERPRISPDGQSIAFNMGHEPTANIYKMPITGGPVKQLTFFDSFALAGGWSNDGKTIAFASNQGGTSRVWIVNADGGTPRALSAGDMSDNFSVSWFPGRSILYQQAGNQNFYQLDPRTAAEHPFVTGEPVGWMFSPAYSPDGAKVAVAWSRPPTRGIWVIGPADHQETLVYESAAPWTIPIGWSADGTAIYALEAKNLTYARGMAPPLGETLTEARITRIPFRGNPTTIATVPSPEIGRVSMTADARRFVYSAYTSRSDVWVVDDFDGPVQRLSRR
jgi:Tol biopolymer transport system component/DNA-binding winged helix-turn-helix (wHTH) protein